MNKKTGYYYAKFICPKCGKRFRAKIYVPKDGNTVVKCGEDLYFELHLHCPQCEEYIPYSNRRN